MKLIRSASIFGSIVWGAATAIFVPFGRFVFGPDNRWPVAVWVSLIVAATFVGVYLFATRVLRRSDTIAFEQGAVLGAFACLPGLILDGALYAVNGGRYPGLNDTASGAMTTALLLAYAATLLATLHAARVTARPAC